ESQDFLNRLDIVYTILDKYYIKTNLSPFYTTILILNPGNCIRYIEVYWPKKWAKPILVSVKQLWEKYREEATMPLLVYMPFSYNNPS
ncbi:hypothetical protein NA56DRAFT_566935, partial [Hyaloscypha hepaticicola]